LNLSIIIVSYNVGGYLRQCLQSIFQSDEINTYEVIVIDNYSFDDSYQIVKDEFPQVKVNHNLENVGFAKAVNQGIKIAKGKYVCILNPDTLLSHDSLSTLLTYYDTHPEIGCLGPKIVNPDGSLQLACKRSIPGLQSAFYKLTGLSKLFPKNSRFGKYNLTYLDENEIHEVEAVSGSCMMIRREILDKVGYFDESFFMYGEDLDLSYRISKLGYKIVYNPNTTIIHYKGESVKNAPMDMVTIFYSALRNFYKKHRKDRLSWRIMQPIVSLGSYLHQLTAYLKSVTTHTIAAFLDAVSITGGFIIASVFWFRLYYGTPMSEINVFTYWPLLLDISVSWYLASIFLKLYHKNIMSYVRAIFTAGVSFFIAATTTYLFEFFAYSRAVLVISCLNIAFFTASWRIMVYLLYKFRKIQVLEQSPLFTRNAAVYGNGEISTKIGEAISNAPQSGIQLLGYIGEKKLNNSTYQVLGRSKDIQGIVSNYQLHEIIIPGELLGIKKIIQLMEKVKGSKVAFKLVPKGQQMLIGKGFIEEIPGVPLLDIEFPIFNKLHFFTKRSFDRLIASLILLITLPIHIFFLLSGKVLRKKIWTVRSACIFIYTYNTPNRILRMLPQLMQVLKGDMSIVGSEMISADLQDPGLMIKPGITGLSQVTQSNAKDPRFYDQYYAMHYSVIFDLEILIKSIIKI
jgi:hypothetical protein